MIITSTIIALTLGSKAKDSALADKARDLAAKADPVDARSHYRRIKRLKRKMA